MQMDRHNPNPNQQATGYEERVHRALSVFNQSIRHLVDEEMALNFGANWKESHSVNNQGRGNSPFRSDVSSSISTIVDNWRSVFSKRLSTKDRSLLIEIREFRNRWAHLETFSFDDCYRVLDSIERVLHSLGDNEGCTEISRQKIDLLREHPDINVPPERNFAPSDNELHPQNESLASAKSRRRLSPPLLKTLTTLIAGTTTVLFLGTFVISRSNDSPDSFGLNAPALVVSKRHHPTQTPSVIPPSTTPKAPQLGVSNRYRDYTPNAESERHRLNGNKWFNKGLRYAQVGALSERKSAFSQAIESYKRSIAIDSRNREAKYNLANTYRELGDRSQPISRLLLESLAPYSKETYKDIGAETTRIKGLEYHLQATKLRGVDSIQSNVFAVRAITEFKSAASINPEDPEPYFNLAVVYLEIGDRYNAYEALGKSIRLSNTENRQYLRNALNVLKLEHQKK